MLKYSAFAFYLFFVFCHNGQTSLIQEKGEKYDLEEKSLYVWGQKGGLKFYESEHVRALHITRSTLSDWGYIEGFYRLKSLKIAFIDGNTSSLNLKNLSHLEELWIENANLGLFKVAQLPALDHFRMKGIGGKLDIDLRDSTALRTCVMMASTAIEEIHFKGFSQNKLEHLNIFWPYPCTFSLEGEFPKLHALLSGGEVTIDRSRAYTPQLTTKTYYKSPR